MSMTAEWVGERIAFDPHMATAVRLLCQHTALATKVYLETREGLTGGQILEVSADPDGVPITMWSSGERMLWEFLVSCSGGGDINLGHLANHFRGSEEEPWIVTALVVLLRPTDAPGGPVLPR